jgi:hypothetical protein
MEFANILNFTAIIQTTIQSVVSAVSVLLATKLVTHAIDKRNRKDKE